MIVPFDGLDTFVIDEAADTCTLTSLVEGGDSAVFRVDDVAAVLYSGQPASASGTCRIVLAAGVIVAVVTTAGGTSSAEELHDALIAARFSAP